MNLSLMLMAGVKLQGSQSWLCHPDMTLQGACEFWRRVLWGISLTVMYVLNFTG